jgi:predicted nucleotidyltransferase
MPEREKSVTALNLPDAWLQEIAALLRCHVPDAEVWAYGSRVSGGAQVCSDLDLVVRDPTDLTQPVTGVSALREALRDSLIPIVVDVHDWAALPVAFRHEIDARHHVLRRPAGRCPG